MIRLVLWSLLILAPTACTTIPASTKTELRSLLAKADKHTPVAINRPLKVPMLAALPETPPRNLKGHFTRVDWANLPGYVDDDLDNLWPLFIHNCKGLMRPVSVNLTAPARSAPRAWQPVCAAAVDPARAPAANDNVAVRKFLANWLTPWQLNNTDGFTAISIITGYYEPLVRGARERGGRYQWPLYTVPRDLLTIDFGGMYPELIGKRMRGKLNGKRVVPYDTHADIARAKHPPPAIIFVDDPIDAFFLQVQGSGRVKLTSGLGSGQTLRVAYADHNGHPYISIGKWLADQGQLSLAQASIQNIRAWAQRNPNRIQEMLNANPAIVFFREETIADPAIGPKGAYGIAIIPERTIAVDASYVPLGAPVFLAATHSSANKPLNHLVFAQDTGAAIKGAARVDYYWGYGDAAGKQAGRMKQQGKMWVLWPTQAGKPSAR